MLSEGGVELAEEKGGRIQIRGEVEAPSTVRRGSEHFS